jgi:hypothetical protein
MARSKRGSTAKRRSRWVVLGRLDERDIESLASLAPRRRPSRIDFAVRDAERATRKGMQLMCALEELSIDALRKELDATSEMSEMESLRLQMAMDRLGKLMSTLSNILKKTSETAATLTANLK